MLISKHRTSSSRQDSAIMSDIYWPTIHALGMHVAGLIKQECHQTEGSHQNCVEDIVRQKSNASKPSHRATQQFSGLCLVPCALAPTAQSDWAYYWHTTTVPRLTCLCTTDNVSKTWSAQIKCYARRNEINSADKWSIAWKLINY